MKWQNKTQPTNWFGVQGRSKGSEYDTKLVLNEREWPHIIYRLLHLMARVLGIYRLNGNAPSKMIFTLCVSFSFYRLISSSVCGRFEKYYSCHWPRGHFFLQRSKLGTFQGKFYEKNTFHEGGLWEILKFAPLKLFYLYFNQSHYT